MQRHAGFTLLELLVAMSIVAVVSAIAIPSFSYINNQRITQSQVDNLQRALAMARQTAIATNRPTIICPSGDGASCGDQDMWSRGYMIYQDSNRNDTYDSSTDRLLEYIPGVRNVATRQDTSHFRHSLSSNHARAAFSTQGFTSDWQTFTYCNGEQRQAFKVTLNRTGRAQVRAGDDSSC
jgi:type IV fimbrial biogenesis protein FimT